MIVYLLYPACRESVHASVLRSGPVMGFQLTEAGLLVKYVTLREGYPVSEEESLCTR